MKLFMPTRRWCFDMADRMISGTKLELTMPDFRIMELPGTELGRCYLPACVVMESGLVVLDKWKHKTAGQARLTLAHELAHLWLDRKGHDEEHKWATRKFYKAVVVRSEHG